MVRKRTKPKNKLMIKKLEQKKSRPINIGPTLEELNNEETTPIRYTPTPEEIRLECEKIRNGWDEYKLNEQEGRDRIEASIPLNARFGYGLKLIEYD